MLAEVVFVPRRSTLCIKCVHCVHKSAEAGRWSTPNVFEKGSWDTFFFTYMDGHFLNTNHILYI